jgi:hypothetical protein
VRPKCRRSSAIRLRASLRDHSKHKPARATTALAGPGCQAGHIRTGCWMLDAVLGSRRFASASHSSQSPSPSQPPGPVLLWPFLSALALLTLATPRQHTAGFIPAKRTLTVLPTGETRGPARQGARTAQRDSAVLTTTLERPRYAPSTTYLRYLYRLYVGFIAEPRRPTPTAPAAPSSRKLPVAPLQLAPSARTITFPVTLPAPASDPNSSIRP